LFGVEGNTMPNDKMMWVLLAPGIASGFCFITEDFIEGLREVWVILARGCRKIW